MTCGHREERKTGTWTCVSPEGHAAGQHYFVRTRPADGKPVCPDCLEGKCGVCMGYALDDATDQIVDCSCATGGH